MIAEFIRGWIWKSSGATGRMGPTNELLVSDAMPRYYDAALQGNTFYAANQAAATWSVALNTTFTGLVVANPAGSGVNGIIKKVGFALSAAPAAPAHIGIFGGYSAAGIITHTTPLVPASSFIGGGRAGKILADVAATLVGTPAWLMPFMGGFTAAAFPGTGPSIMDVEGSIIIPPGGYVGIGALTAVVGFGAIIYDEVPIT